LNTSDSGLGVPRWADCGSTARNGGTLRKNNLMPAAGSLGRFADVVWWCRELHKGCMHFQLTMRGVFASQWPFSQPRQPSRPGSHPAPRAGWRPGAGNYARRADDFRRMMLLPASISDCKVASPARVGRHVWRFKLPPAGFAQVATAKRGVGGSRTELARSSRPTGPRGPPLFDGDQLLLGTPRGGPGVTSPATDVGEFAAR
jgi:hypothetical protein